MSIAITIIAVWLLLNVAVVAIRLWVTRPVRSSNVYRLKRVRAWPSR